MVTPLGGSWGNAYRVKHAPELQRTWESLPSMSSSSPNTGQNPHPRNRRGGFVTLWGGRIGTGRSRRGSPPLATGDRRPGGQARTPWRGVGHCPTTGEPAHTTKEPRAGPGPPVSARVMPSRHRVLGAGQRGRGGVGQRGSVVQPGAGWVAQGQGEGRSDCDAHPPGRAGATSDGRHSATPAASPMKVPAEGALPVTDLLMPSGVRPTPSERFAAVDSYRRASQSPCGQCGALAVRTWYDSQNWG